MSLHGPYRVIFRSHITPSTLMELLPQQCKQALRGSTLQEAEAEEEKEAPTVVADDAVDEPAPEGGSQLCKGEAKLASWLI